MSSYKLTFRHIGDEAAIVLLFLVNCLLLRYVLIVGHQLMVGVVVTIIIFLSLIILILSFRS